MRYCKLCGKEMEDNAQYCPRCGCSLNESPIENIFGSGIDLLSVIGFILSFFFAVPGLVVSVIAYGNVKNQPSNTNKNFAKAGIAISILRLCLYFFGVACVIVLAILGVSIPFFVRTA